MRLAAIPRGAPRHQDFELAEVEVPELLPGQILVSNTWMSVDPATRVMMLDGDRPYAGTFAPGRPLAGFAVGRVVETRAPGFKIGEALLHGSGWRELAVLDATGLDPSSRIPLDDRSYLGPLGWPGLTAYAGILVAAELEPGDTIFISAAAGGVGSLAVQIAKLRGHRVIASAGSAEKVAYIRDELGADAAFCYRDGDVSELLAAAAPDGIDAYFDLVGGDHLEAALGALHHGGRAILGGAISTYNSEEPVPGPDLFDAIAKGLIIRGFNSPSYVELIPDLRRQMGEWLASEAVVFPETIFDGVDQAPGAMIDVMSGRATGKAIVKV